MFDPVAELKRLFLQNDLTDKFVPANVADFTHDPKSKEL